MANENIGSISKARNYEEMAEFWDTHSLADYWDQTHEVEMTVDPSARRSIVQGRLHELRRNQIAVRAQEAKRNYEMENVQRGTVEDFMNSLKAVVIRNSER